MANNFRTVPVTSLTTYYVSKAGVDTNAGTSKDAPKATVNSAFNTAFGSSGGGSFNIMIGTGTYEEALNYGTWKAGTGSAIYSDGNVLLRGTGSNGLTFMRTSPFSAATFNNLRFENYSSISASSQAFNNCLFKDITFINISYNTSPNPGCTNCIFINCAINFGSGSISSSANVKVDNCIFINCTVTINQFTEFKSNYLNSASTLNMQTANNDAAYCDYNNIMGNIKVGSDTAMSLAAHQAAYSTYNTHSINASPLFNNVSKLDFTLQSSSPHIGGGASGTNIGGTNYAQAAYTITPGSIWDTGSGATISKSDGTNPDLIVSGNDLVLAAGKTSGYITSAPFRVSVNPQIIQNIGYAGLLLFNKSQSGGSATNQNVPDAQVYTGSDATGGGNPDRLVFEMRWTDQDDQPSTGTDWINGNISGLAGSWLKFAWNAQPLIDTLNYPSGDPAFNTATGQAIAATWIQLRVTLTNAYL